MGIERLGRRALIVGVLLVAAVAVGQVPGDEITAEIAAAVAWDASPVFAEPQNLPPHVPDGTEATVFFSDFEGSDGGLLATRDWEWGAVYSWNGATCTGTYVQPPGAYSGTGMWGTVLNSCYNNLGNNQGSGSGTCSNTNPSDDSILTLTVDLTGYADAALSWWEWFDVFSYFDWAEVRINGASVLTYCPSSYTAPSAWVQQALDLTSYVGGSVTIEWHFMASTVVDKSGWYIDDVSVTGTTAGGPSITLSKTVGTTPGVCASTSTITVPSGTDVYYCFVAENTGDVTFEYHDLADDHLGTVLDDFPYTLAPGASSPEVIVQDTVTAAIVNTATWTASTSLGGYTVQPTTFNFVDISATGTALNLTDDGEANITSPFPFTFYGVTSTDLRVGNNGGILFNRTTGDLGTTNSTLPNGTIGQAILPFWDDIDSDTGNVYWEVQGTAPSRTLIVEWYNRPHYSNVGSATFEAILYEGTNAIEFHYLDTDFGNASYNAGVSATVGINNDGTTALQYSYNEAVITDGLALRFESVLPESASATASATVILSDPDIDVTPASLTSTLLVGGTETQALTIGNVGDGALDWTLNEAPPNAAVFPQMSEPAGPGDPSLAAERADEQPQGKVPDWFAPPVDWELPQQVLFDNGPLVTHPGGGAGGADASALQTALGMNTLGAGAQVSAGNRVADDFTIAGSNWTVETITFFTYQTGSGTTSTINALNVRIWDGPPDNPASTVVWGDTTTNILTTSTWSNIYRVTDTTMTNTDRPIMTAVAAVNTALPPGTYWVDWQIGGTLASGPWVPPVTILGQTTTGNAKQYTSTGWANLTDSGTLTPQGVPFIIEGTSSNCYSPSDIPWLSASPLAGTTPAGGNSNVDVTFDASAVGVGTYDALLCVFSNDPDEPLVEVPVQMNVVIPVELMSISIE